MKRARFLVAALVTFSLVVTQLPQALLQTPPASAQDITVQATAVTPQVAPGQNAEFRLVVTNVRQSPIELQLSFNTPAGLSMVTSQGNAGCPANAPYLCEAFTLAPGNTRTLSVFLRVGQHLPCGTNINVAFDIRGVTEPIDVVSTASLLVSCSTTPPPPPPPSGSGVIEFVASTPNVQVQAGQNAEYILNVTNGLSTPASLYFAFNLPFGLSLVRDQGDVSCPAGGPPHICNPFTLQPGQNRSFRLFLRVGQNVPCGSNINVAFDLRKSDDPSFDLVRVVNHTVTCQPQTTDVTVEKTGPSSVQQGSQITYQLRAINNGQIAAQNVTLVDTFPAGFQFVSSTPSGCFVQSGTVRCPVGTLAANDSRNFSITFQTPAPAQPCVPGSVTNTGSVESSNDSTSGNNSQSVQTSLTCPAPQTTTLVAEKEGPATVVRGNTVTYTVRVRNVGQIAAQNVQLTDTFPSQFTFVTASAGCSHTQGANTVVCSAGTVPAGQVREFQMTFSVAPAQGACQETPVINAVTTVASNATPASASATTVLVCPQPLPPNLTVSKTSNQGSVQRGQTITYTLTVTNNGQGVANGVTLTDTFPAGFTFVSSPGCTSQASGVAVCPVGQLNPGQTRNIELTLRAPDASGVCQESTATNHVQAIGSNASSVSATLTTNVTCPPPGPPQLILSKTSNQASVERGQTITYNLSVTNNGQSPAQNVVITDTFPAGFTFVSSSGCTNPFGGGTATCVVGQLNPGSTQSFDLTLRAPLISGVCLNTTAVNQAGATATNAVSAGATLTTSLTCPPPPPNADVLVEKTASSTSVTRGGTITYTLRARNLGPATAFGVTLIDEIPGKNTPNDPTDDLEFVPSQSTSGCDLSADGQRVHCNGFTLASGAFQEVQITMRAPQLSGVCADRTVVNVGRVSSSTTDLTDSNNRTEITTQVICPPPQTTTLLVTKTREGGSNDPVERGGTLSYVITVQNTGPIAATNVQVTDPVPNGLVFQSVTAHSEGTCNVTNNVVTCSLASLAAGQSRSFTVRFQVPVITPCIPMTVTNIASATAAQAPNTSSAAISTQVTCPQPLPPNLVVTKTSDQGSVQRGGQIVYKLRVTNNGQGPAHNVTLTDTFPDGFTFVSSSGCTNPSGGNTAVCPVGQLNPGETREILLTLQAPAASGVCQPGSALNQLNATSSNASFVSTSLTTPITCPQQTDANLLIQKIASSTTVTRGGTVTYTLRATNFGPATAQGVTFIDHIPGKNTPNDPTDDLAFVASQSSQGCDLSADGQRVHCNGFTLAPNESREVQITMQAPVLSGACVERTVVNRASISSSTTDLHPENNNAEVSTQVTCPPPQTTTLQLTKTREGGANNPVERGGTLSYVLTVQNTGTIAATNVTVTDQVPSGVVFLSATAQSEGTCGVSNNVVSCFISSLASGQSRSFTVRFQVPVVDPCTTATVTNIASASATQAVNVSSSAISTQITCPQVLNPFLVASKTSSINSVQRGGQITYALSVTNIGQGAAQNVVLTDTFPAGFTFVSSNGCSSVSGTNTATCNVGQLNPSQTREFQLTLQAPAVSGTCQDTSVVNQLQATGSSSNTATTSLTTNLTCPPPQTTTLLVTKAREGGSNNPIDRGGVLTYVVTVQNTGTIAATNVTVTDQVPSGVVFQNAVAQEGSCGVTNNVVTCTLASLAAGQSRNFTLSFQVPVVTPCTTLTVSNIASASAGNAANASSSSISTQVTCPQPQTTTLQITQAGPSEIQRGNNAVYTVTVTNIGNVNATNTVTTVTLPTNVTFQSANIAGGGACTVTNGVASCPLGTLTPGQSRNIVFTYLVPVTQPCQTGTISHVASAVADQAPSVTNTFVTQIICPSQAGFTVTKTDSRAFAAAGEVLEYVITVRNNASTTLTNVTVNDYFPTQLEFDSFVTDGSSEQGGVVSNQGATPTLTWSGKTFAPNEQKTFKFRARIKAGTAAGVDVVNTAQVNLNETATDTTRVQQNIPQVGCIQVTKEAITASGGQSGTSQPFTFRLDNGTQTLTINGNGQSFFQSVPVGDHTVTETSVAGWTHVTPATVNVSVSTGSQCAQVKFRNQEAPSTPITGCIRITKEIFNTLGQQLPQGSIPAFTFRLANGSQTVSNDSNGVAQFNNVPVGQHTVTEDTTNGWFQLSATPANGIVNVSAGSQCSAIIFKNQQTTPPGTTPSNNFTITKTDHESYVQRGDELTYEITVRNNGSTGATQTVTDTLPEHVRFDWASQGGYLTGYRTVTWSNQYFPANQERTFTVRVIVSDQAYDDERLVNRATITGLNLSAEDETRVREEDRQVSRPVRRIVLSNNREPIRVRRVNTSAEITVSKLADRSEVLPGTEVSYNVTVRNQSDATASNVTITDTFPAGMLRIVSPGAGQVYDNRIVWNVQQLAPGESRTFNYIAMVASGLRNGTEITNTVSVRSPDLSNTPTAISTVRVGVLLPQTGAGNTGPLENTGRFLSPLGSSAGSTPAIVLVALALMGLAGAGTIGKRFFL